jgi:hypothetical protein
MTTTNGVVLEQGRKRMKRGGGIEQKDLELFVAAGLAEGFNPETNTTDARIEKYLNGSYGHPWREKIKPRQPALTPDEARDYAVKLLVMAEDREVYDPAVSERFAVERLYNNPPRGTTPEQLVQLAKRYRAAVEAQRKATENLERSTAAVTTILMDAQRRRQWESMEKLTPSADSSAARFEANGRPVAGL